MKASTVKQPKGISNKYWERMIRQYNVTVEQTEKKGVWKVEAKTRRQIDNFIQRINTPKE